MADNDKQEKGNEDEGKPTMNHWWIKFFNFLFRNVSIIHLQEAEGRYWILWREIEIAFTSLLSKLGIPAEPIPKDDPKGIDKYIKEILAHLTEKSNKKEQKEKLERLLFYCKILVKDKERLSRKGSNLSILWRDMTFIRIRLLTDRIIEPSKLPLHLNFCQAEASFMNVQDEPEVRQLINEAEIELLRTSKSDHQNDKGNEKVVHCISKILTKLNILRIQRLHKILGNKHKYQVALIIAIILSFVLLSFDPAPN